MSTAETPAPESIPEGDMVVGKQHSSAEPGQVSKKKKRKTGAHGSDDGEDKSLSGKKRQKKQAVKGNAKTSTPLISVISPISNTRGSKSPSNRKRSSEDKSQEADIGTPLDHSPHKKPKLSSKKMSSDPGKTRKSGKSPKALGSSKSGKKGDKRR